MQVDFLHQKCYSYNLRPSYLSFFAYVSFVSQLCVFDLPFQFQSLSPSGHDQQWLLRPLATNLAKEVVQKFLHSKCDLAP